MNPPDFPFLWLNGKLLPAAEACLPVADRGFRYGDGLFETLRVSQGKPEFWQAHVARLLRGMEALKLPPLAYDLADAARTLIAANTQPEGVLRIALSRGPGGRGYLPPAQPQPTLLLEMSPLPPAPTEPLRLWHASLRRPGPQHLPSDCKTANALGSVLARMEAETQACDEALMTDAQGNLSECAAANLVWQEPDGTCFTPALESGAVAGVARQSLLQLGFIEEITAPLARLPSAVAVASCNSLYYTCPIASLAPYGWRWESQALAARCHAALSRAAAESQRDFA